jgi:hypothetical protein
MNMDKKSVGLLLGAATGFTLGWLFRHRIAGLFDQRAEIIVGPNGSTEPHVVFVTPEVTVKRNKDVRWLAINNSKVDVVVALADWQDLNHQPVRPAVDPDPDDHEHPPQKGLTREVPAGKHRPIRGRARGPNGGKEEKVKYAVYLGDRLEVDPIVKLTP